MVDPWILIDKAIEADRRSLELTHWAEALDERLRRKEHADVD